MFVAAAGFRSRHFDEIEGDFEISVDEFARNPLAESGGIAQRHVTFILYRFELRLPLFPAFGSGGVAAVAVDILNVNGDGSKAGQIARELVDFVAQNLRGEQPYGCRAPGRIVPGGEGDVEKALRRIACLRERSRGVQWRV